MRAKMTRRDVEKERRIVATVIAVCLIFIVGTLPFFVMHVLLVVYPPFSNDNPYLQSVALLVATLGLMFQLLLSSVNFFVYLKTNVRYRLQFFALFGRNSKTMA